MYFVKYDEAALPFSPPFRVYATPQRGIDKRVINIIRDVFPGIIRVVVKTKRIIEIDEVRNESNKIQHYTGLFE